MNNTKYLSVSINGAEVGGLALKDSYFAAFEYSKKWIAEGFSISPRTLPLEKGVFTPNWEPFDGLFGVFEDCLPDGWGRLLVDRWLSNHGIDKGAVSELTRIAMLGAESKGALEFEPTQKLYTHLRQEGINFDELAAEALKIYEDEESHDLDTVLAAGGSSGGARPKALLRIEGEEWIIKFPTTKDGQNAGVEEFAYAKCAELCGIIMAETKLFESNSCPGFFGTKRFDRRINSDGTTQRIHMVSAGGILESSYRLPALNYLHLFNLTQNLTRDFSQAEQLFRTMCFNVFAHNQDDHAKNFAYLCADGIWSLAPAYDLTYSSTWGDEQSTMVGGAGRDIGQDDMLEVGHNAGLSKRKCREIIEQVETNVHDILGDILRSKGKSK